MYLERIERALRSFPESIPDEFPDELPLLDRLRESRGARHRSLERVDVLHIQHTLGPLLPRLQAMVDDGLDPQRYWLVDVPYSTNERVRREIPRRFGVPQGHFAAPLRDPLEPYLTVQMRRVEEIVYRLAHREDGGKLLVVDDGAYFTRAVHRIEELEPGFADAFRGRTHIVEQTTRGHRYLEEPEQQSMLERLDAPAVSIARVSTKVQFEAPFIGACASRSLVRALRKEGIDPDRVGKVAVIGFGAVGRSVFHALGRLGHDGPIHVVDPDIETHDDIRRNGGVASVPPLPRDGSYDLVVGCTGYGSFGLRDRACLSRDACLVSTSSAAVEFNRKQFIDLAEMYPDDEIEILHKNETRKQGIHATIHFRDGERRIRFINASYPVNFNGQMECLPLYAIQATHALLYEAGSQSLKSKQAGMTGLDRSVDEEINELALKFL